MSQKYPGGFITKSPVAPTSSAAKGVWTLDQAMQLQKQGLWPSPPPIIGQAYGGGYFAGQINVSGTIYNLVVSDKTVGEAYGKKWGTPGENTGVTSLIDGPANTTTLAGLGADYEAAIFCENLNTGGYTDWYLPSFNELTTIYYFLKPSTTINNTGTGATANAVSPQPISTNYTTGNPAQTSATSFRNGASSQEFVLANYWVSLAYVPLGNNNAWTRDFTNGEEGVNTKTITTYYTRAIRRVLA